MFSNILKKLRENPRIEHKPHRIKDWMKIIFRPQDKYKKRNLIWEILILIQLIYNFFGEKKKKQQIGFENKIKKKKGFRVKGLIKNQLSET